ncbi:hypothetical protein AK830_g4524 [Neonectria ditissima]|uniref:Major facilitator superfamily (MFS) profile domain-containing protein n=1 Tax=Neonectria ditissima TaxID=78410 RepID=A0A0P7B6A3_9HYPO|nr:hypothetical protein AK830_g4524 [Neonectria ditissima]
MMFRSVTVPRGYLLQFLAAALFVIQLGLSMSDLPSVRLMQDIVCKHHFNVTTGELLSEEQCRIEPVQQELNLISMGILVSATIGGKKYSTCALVSFPLGVLADRMGRVPVLALSILSICLSQAYAMYICWQWKSVPLKAIWGIGAPLLLGGGRSVAEAMVFTILSDVVPAAKRATWFQWIVASVLSAQLLGPVLAGRFIQSSIWMPLFLSLGLLFTGGVFLAMFTPETLPPKWDRNPYDMGVSKPTASILQTLKHLFSAPALWLLPGAVLTIPLATTQSELLLRLMPVQFDWPLDQSVLLISLRSLTTLITLCVVLPGITILWTKFANRPSHRLDYLLARGSVLLFMAGSLCLMMITSESLIIAGIIISALGSGLPTLCRAMLVGLSGGERTGSLFGMLAVGEVIGFLALELGMGALFGVGLRTWMGSPFCLGIVVAMGIGLATWMVPVPQTNTMES